MSNPPLLQASQTSPRPTSTGSYFADSAINIDLSTPPPLKSLPPLDALYTTSSGLFERLNRIAAAAWDAEQDGRLTEGNVKTLHNQLDGLESGIAGTDTESIDGLQHPHETHTDPPHTFNHFPTVDLEAFSTTLLTSLRSATSSLRLRYTEHRHLLSLSTSRLETLAQRCIAQERAIQSLTRQLQDLRNENNVLGKANEDATVEIKALKMENSSKQLAMEAMVGAVSGLEGWIESTMSRELDIAAVQEFGSGRRRGKRREVIRGRGRFRGRYYIDEHDPGGHPDVDTDVRDLHDGVKAWLRGFRDVEEGLRARGEMGRRRQVGNCESVENEVVEDEWGDFESAG